MKKITEVNKETCDVITKAAMDALKGVAEPLGVTAKRGRAMYSPNDGTVEVKVTFAVADAERLTFESNARYHGLKAEDYGREFTHPTGKKFRVVGIRPNARTKTILVESDGKEYTMDHEVVRDLLDGKDLRAEFEAKIKAREDEALKMKPGDLGVLEGLKPKYLNENIRVRIISVDKKKKTAEVEWADYDARALKNTGPKFVVVLGAIAPVPGWLERAPLREERLQPQVFPVGVSAEELIAKFGKPNDDGVITTPSGDSIAL